MAIYYIDNMEGKEENDGLSPASPILDYQKITPKAGDTLLFKRGSFYRAMLHMQEGEDGRPITYGAYGEGDRPTFSGSLDVSSPECWGATERENVWRCIADIPTDVGNFVFNDEECTAALIWDREQLAHQGDFFDSRFSECNRNNHKTVSAQEVLLYSVKNPGEYYSHIEALAFGTRRCGNIASNTIIDGICFKNSGVHGITGAGMTRNVIIRNCHFKNIGGCGWSRELKIRFGNAIEFWIGADNVLIENNLFESIYDSCITQQGPGDKTPSASNFHIVNNIFDTYSMAAMEYRDAMMINSSFVGNICRNAGCGFGMLGESLPRRSEIWPQPMGHHIFLWRMERPAEGGSLLIANNRFESAPNGAAVYSIICPGAEAQISFRDNTYTGEQLMQAYFGKEQTKTE